MAIGMEPDEGVQIAIFPAQPDESRLGEPYAINHNIKGIPVWGTCGAWGERLLDIVTDPPSPVRWWKVRDYAAEQGVDLVPVSWAGAAQDIPEHYFKEPNLGIRLFSEGPWFWPFGDRKESYGEKDVNGL